MGAYSRGLPSGRGTPAAPPGTLIGQPPVLTALAACSAGACSVAAAALMCSGVLYPLAWSCVGWACHGLALPCSRPLTTIRTACGLRSEPISGLQRRGPFFPFEQLHNSRLGSTLLGMFAVLSMDRHTGTATVLMRHIGRTQQAFASLLGMDMQVLTSLSMSCKAPSSADRCSLCGVQVIRKASCPAAADFPPSMPCLND